MKNNRTRAGGLKGSSGFTLIELLVVVLIIGILAAIAVPQYFKVVEKGKIVEAIQFCGILADAQEHYLAQNGVYCTSGVPGSCAPPFDVNVPIALNNYAIGSLAVGPGGGNCPAGNPDWEITLTRVASGGASCPTNYGCYTVTYDHCGAVIGGNIAGVPLSCSSPACEQDLMPQ